MKNIIRYLTFTDIFHLKNKRWKIVEYAVTVIFFIYLGLICYPNILFGYSINYKNFNLHSTTEIDNNIYKILDNAKANLADSSINDTTATYNVYLCNNYSLYSFLAPKSRGAFANTYAIIHNIFVSNCDIKRNEAYKNDEKDSYVRQLSSLITHEAAHILTEKKLGFWKYWFLEQWKNEGYSEFVGYNKTADFVLAKKFLEGNLNNDVSSVYYKRCYYAVAYLIQVEGMNFEEVIASEYSLEDVLCKIEKMENRN